MKLTSSASLDEMSKACFIIAMEAGEKPCVCDNALDINDRTHRSQSDRFQHGDT